jgi:hypothetical protein
MMVDPVDGGTLHRLLYMRALQIGHVTSDRADDASTLPNGY